MRQKILKNHNLFIYFLKKIDKYWVSVVLMIILLTLIRQNFFINQFPFSLINKQTIINQNKQTNQEIRQQNQSKLLQLETLLSTDMQILESQARYRFGLVRKGERYYQIYNPYAAK